MAVTNPNPNSTAALIPSWVANVLVDFRRLTLKRASVLWVLMWAGVGESVNQACSGTSSRRPVESRFWEFASGVDISDSLRLLPSGSATVGDVYMVCNNV